ncbi:MAG: SH3 domain-containing protein [Saprospiraceae bacterium]
MKNVILLLAIFLSANIAFAQNSSALYSTPQNSPQSVAATFAEFEQTVFTESDVSTIISTYIEMAKKQKDAGHLSEAAVFYERAFVLAEEYYQTQPGKKNPLEQIRNSYQSMLAICGAKRNNSGVVNALNYLQRSKNNRFTQGNTLSQEKVVASFFLDATEPAKPAQPSFTTIGNFKITKATSLRRKATHKSKVLQRLPVGKSVAVLEKTNKHWWKVNIDGREGYVKALLLQ